MILLQIDPGAVLALILLLLTGVAVVAAVQFLSARDPASRVRGLLSRGDALQLSGDVDGAKELFQDAAGQLSAIGYEPSRRELCFEVHARLGALAVIEDEYESADEHLQMAIDHADDLLSPRAPHTLAVLGNQALVHFELGRDAAAEEAFAKVLAYEPDDYTPELHVASEQLRQIAMACVARDVYRWPVALLERALALHDQRLDPDPGQCDEIAVNLAQTHLCLGEFHLAARWLDELEGPDRGESRTDGTSQPPVDESSLFVRLHLDESALVLRQHLAVLKCDWTAAESCSEQLLELCRSPSGTPSESMAAALLASADVRLARGAFGEARQLAHEALKMRESCLGESYPSLAYHLLSAASACTQLGDIAAAEEHLDRGLRLGRSRRRRANAVIGALSLARGVLEVCRDRFAEAEDACRRARRIAEDVYGLGHRQTDDSVLVLSEALALQGRHEDARALLNEARAIREHSPGVSVLDTIDLFNAAAGVQFLAGDLAAAERDVQQAIELIDRHLDRTHFTYAVALERLAAVRHAQGRTDEADSHFREAIDLQLQVRLPQHPLFAGLFDDYARLLDDTGRDDEASAYRTRAAAIREVHGMQRPHR